MGEKLLTVLDTVVDEYIKTGKPVSGAGIQSQLPFKVSAATVRAHMAELEQQGYLDHPHTSAGRVPTIKGYRSYILRMTRTMEGQPHLTAAERAEADRLLEQSVTSGESYLSDSMVIETAAEVLSEVTKCAIVTTNNTFKYSVITKVEVVPTGHRMYVLLIVTSGGDIKNRVCRLSFDVTHEQMDFFVKFVNESLTGINLSSLSEEYVRKLAAALGNYVMTLSPLLTAVAELSAQSASEHSHVSVKGETKLIVSEDLKKQEIAALLDRRGAFTDFTENLLEGAFSGIQVVFGGEGNFAVENGSMVAAGFNKGDKPAGGFAAIGPLRLDYKKIIPYMEYFTDRVTKMLSAENPADSGEV